MKDTTGVCSLALTETLAGSLGQSSVPSCLHCRARRAKWQVELLPEKCTHAGPLCLLLSLSSPPVASAAFSLLFGADAAAMCCYCGRKKSERTTHTYTLTHTSSAGVRLKAKPRSCLSVFSLDFFFSVVGVLRDRGRE